MIIKGWLRRGLALLLFSGLSGQAGTVAQAVPTVLRGPLRASVEERIVSNACSVLRPDQLPADSRTRYPSVEPRCGTGAILELVQNWDRLQTGTRAKLTTFFQRPSSQRTFTSPSGRFLVHYDLTGFHAVDTDDADGNGIPDYVDVVAETFDEVWVHEIDVLGYRVPEDDGDGVYDVHIQQLGLQGVYGLAFPTGTTETITSSYIQIDNDFIDNVYQTRGTDGVQVTAAHEFFHAIQFAYFASFDAAWWQELTATWMEDVVYDDVNDYYQYQPDFFLSPETSLDAPPFLSIQPFAASVFAHHIQQVYGTQIIRDTWESLHSRTPSSYDILDIDAAIPGGFANVLPRFIVWNYLTGGRFASGYYEEGAFYQQISPKVVAPSSDFSVGGSARIDHLASTYISIDTRTMSGGLRVTFSLEEGSTYEVVMMLLKSGSPEVVSLSGAEVSIANVGQYDEVVLVPISTSMSGSSFHVSYMAFNSSTVTATSDKVGDFDGDGSVAFADFLSFSASFGEPATEAGHIRQNDLNADGEIGFGDFLIFASHFGE